MKTHLFCIIDRSGSMSGLERATIDGYNEYVDKLRDQDDVHITLVLFDHEVLVPVDDQPISSSPKLNSELYVPRGSTALIDAVCRTLNGRKGKVSKEDKALVLVITDGFENASSEYTSKKMQKLIHGLEKQGNWTFTYLGANQDAWATAQQYGFKVGNVGAYAATPTGTSIAFDAMAVNSRGFTMSSARSVNSFYSNSAAQADSKEGEDGEVS